MISSRETQLRYRVLRAFAASALVAACGGSARAQARVPAVRLAVRAVLGAQQPGATPKPLAAWSSSVHSLRDSILVSVVRTQIGTRYVHGGAAPEDGFDCSGLVRYVMAALDVALPRTAAQQAQMGLDISRDSTRLRPGDLLTFGKDTRRGDVSHIGIYVGHGLYVHASSVAGRVIESNLDRPASPLIRRWRGTRRVVASAESDSTPKAGS